MFVFLSLPIGAGKALRSVFCILFILEFLYSSPFSVFCELFNLPFAPKGDVPWLDSPPGSIDSTGRDPRPQPGTHCGSQAPASMDGRSTRTFRRCCCPARRPRKFVDFLFLFFFSWMVYELVYIVLVFILLFSSFFFYFISSGCVFLFPLSSYLAFALLV
ncbi:hypothetical protein HPP92_026165 [Vanilla planifolia]|uniref:Uncharacterized protein n=1 Tax=Vanilla planifolia TaxID=51239 RepID=A0A835PH35_VANPL|nr:hypothetical protein HPP92_026165 [Vanilla planifolia]